jgi:hypothetical protein
MNICESVAPSISSELTTKLEVCPWSLRRFGLVSLLDMLRYAAEDFVEITKILTSLELRPGSLKDEQVQAKFQQVVNRLSGHLANLEMTYSQNQVETAIAAVNRMDWEIASREIDQLLRRILEELKARSFRYVDKPSYEFGLWLMNPDLRSVASHPDIRPEIEAAGRCYAYGESTACIFHLMRVIDYGLRLVAASLGIAYDARSWDGIGKAIEKKMREKYGDKTDDWKASEPFYAEILTDIQAISRGHRNEALHELEKKYDEREAQYLLTVATGFIQHVLSHTGAGNLKRA